MSRFPLVPALPYRCRGAAALLALALLAAAANAEPPQAPDRLDQLVNRKALKLLDYLQTTKGYKNVGVLKFRVKQGDQPETFDAGVLPSVLANTVENALILKNDDTPPLGIIRNARCEIAKKVPRFSYLKDDHRDKLFDVKDYPLAWGNNKVEADAFVTGLVTINPGKATLTITFEVLDRETKKLTVWESFEARTDRAVLADLCQGFALAKGKIGTAGYNPDAGADEDADRRDRQKVKLDRDDMLVDLKILYDGKEQTVADHSYKPGAFQVGQPLENQVVTFTLTNLTDQRLGVVLAINGENTLHQEIDHDARPEHSSRWILEPKQSYVIRGFYNNNEVVPIKVLSDAESDRLDQNPTPRLGAIEMFIFVEQQQETASKEPMAERDVLRAPIPPARKPRTRQEAQNESRSANPIKVSTAGYMVAGDKAEPADVKSASLKNPQMWRNVVIWYRDPPKAGEK